MIVYTDKEIELYEHLASIKFIADKFQNVSLNSISAINELDSDNKTHRAVEKVMNEFIGETVKLIRTVDKEKIPKKFLTLNKL